jgi:hypothetical protein
MSETPAGIRRVAMSNCVSRALSSMFCASMTVLDRASMFVKRQL